MKPILWTIVFLLISQYIFADNSQLIHLKDGKWITGILVESIADSIKILLPNGSSYKANVADIESIQVIESVPVVEETPKQSVNRAFPLALSIYFPLHGLGQFYNHDTDKGIFYLSLGIVGTTLIYSGYRKEIDKKGSGKIELQIGSIIYLGSLIYSCIDAYRSAR